MTPDTTALPSIVVEGGEHPGSACRAWNSAMPQPKRDTAGASSSRSAAIVPAVGPERDRKKLDIREHAQGK